MGRSGYSDYGDTSQWDMIKNGVVKSPSPSGESAVRHSCVISRRLSMRCRIKKLIAHELAIEWVPDLLVRWLFAGCWGPGGDYADLFPYFECGVCTIGALGAARRVDMSHLDPTDHETLGATFDIAHQLVQEVEWENDEGGYDETPEQRVDSDAGLGLPAIEGRSR